MSGSEIMYYVVIGLVGALSAMIALWAASVYLARKHKNYLLTAIPATFMSAVSATYFMVSGECMGLLWTPMGIPMSTYYPIAVAVGIAFAAAMLVLFLKKIKKYKEMPVLEE